MKEKKCTIFKRVFSLAMAVFMTLMLAMPAMVRSEVASAAGESGNYKIIIRHKTNLPAMEDGQFKAYQIFTGVLNPEEKDPLETAENLQLSDIKWGKGVNSENLISALIQASKDSNSALKDVFSEDLKSDTKSAEHIAYILADKADEARFLQAFADIVEKCKINTAAISSALEGEDSVIDCKEQGSGYYLVVQETAPGIGNESDRNEVYSDFILQVVGEQTIDIKADIPDVEKKIINGNASAKDNADSAGIGEEVTFQITGTLPAADTYEDYETYIYKFTDTLSRGLKYKEESLTIAVKGYDGVDKIDVVKSETENSDGKKAVLTVGEYSSDKGTSIEVSIKDLKKIIPENTGSAVNIIVTYKAVVNEDAVIGDPGQTNEVSLEYSNNPNEESTGKTTTKIVHEYSFKLDLTKKGDDTGAPLSGAKFVLKNSEDKIAVFGDAGDGTGVKKLSKWETLEEAEDAGGISVDGDGNITVVTDKYYIESQGTTGEFGVQGLGEGTYTLVEVVTPDGYNTLDPITFTITPEYDAEGNLIGLSVDVSGSRSDDVTVNTITPSSGEIPMELVNHKAPTLPNTGGIGTIIFYVAGGLLLAGAAVYLVVSRTRKETK